MKKIISIEYCTSWGYLPKAVALASNLLDEHKNSLEMVKIIPSSGGVFEVTLDDKLIFSKKQLGRFPNKDEVEETVRNEVKKIRMA